MRMVGWQKEHVVTWYVRGNYVRVVLWEKEVIMLQIEDI